MPQLHTPPCLARIHALALEHPFGETGSSEALRVLFESGHNSSGPLPDRHTLPDQPALRALDISLANAIMTRCSPVSCDCDQNGS